MNGSEPHSSEPVAPASTKLGSPGFWAEHAALLLTLTYLLLIVIGVLYEFFLFLGFNVNILYFAEATDFILVPFREPLVILVCLAPIPLWIGYMGLMQWLDASFRRGIARAIPRWGEALENRRKEPTALARGTLVLSSVLGIALWSVAATARYARHVRDEIRGGERQIVNIELAGEPARSIEGTLVGTTAHYVFVYEQNARKTRVIPVENLASILVAPRRTAESDRTVSPAHAPTTAAGSRPEKSTPHR